MSSVNRVPIRITVPSVTADSDANDQSRDGGAVAPEAGQGVHRNVPVNREAQGRGVAPELLETSRRQENASEDSGYPWRGRALLLQAEMERFRSRARLAADARVEAERAELLRSMLSVADDLERALGTDEAVDSRSLKEGVEITHRNLIRLMQQSGVEPLKAEGMAFDPSLHEAVGVANSDREGPGPARVVKVLERGYKLGGRLLRPAKVIVSP